MVPTTNSGDQYSFNLPASMTASAGTLDIQLSVAGTKEDGSADTPVTKSLSVNVEALPNTKPEITLNGSSNVTITQFDSYTDAGATCTDAEDAACTVTTSGSVDTDTAGIYTLSFDAEDSNGADADTLTRTVTVEALPVAF